MKPAIFVLLTAWILEAGDLRVLVRDPSGANIPGATVRAGAAERLSDSRGEALFPALSNTRIELSIVAPGFRTYSTSITVRPGLTTIDRTLTIAPRRDELEVGLDPKEELSDPRSDRLSTVLTEKEIELLPDDQEQFEQAIRDLAGPGAVIRVDGFRGGRLPPKSQIQSIRFRLTPYAADEHDDGFVLIDITTKPGLGEWHGNLSFAFGDDSLNARNAFAPRREPQQARRLDLSLQGPVFKNRTSTSFNFLRNDGYDSRTAVGVLPHGPFANLVRLPSLFTNAGSRVQHLLSRTQVLRGDYQYEQTDRTNIGSFDLPERASQAAVTQHQLRLSGQGTLRERLVNDWRFQAQWAESANSSLTAAPSLIVQGAFASGGANADSTRTTNAFELADHFAFHKGKHAFRAGGQADYFRYNGRDFTNGMGTTIYSSLAAFLANQPALLSRRSAEVAVDYRQTRLAAFLHDDIRALKSLSLSFGLRMEGMSQVPGKANPAPRAGFAWAPFQRSKTTFRGGAGIYYQWFEGSLYEETLRLNGASQADLITSANGVGRPGFLRPASGWQMPYTIRYSAGLQHQLPGRFNLMMDFRQERGLHQFRSRNVNPEGSGYGYLLELETAARTSTRGLMVGLSSMPSPDAKGLRGRIYFNSFYFLGQSRDEVSGPLAPPANSLRARDDWGPSANDVRHRFNAMLQTTLPKGFQLGTFLNLSSALPYNITTGADGNGDTFFNDRPFGVPRNSARGAAQVNTSARLSWSRGFGQRQTSGGGAMMMRMRTDGGIPDGPIGGGASNAWVRMQIYAQAANVLNRLNPAGFIGVTGSPYFGQATMAAPPRRIELGLRANF